MSFIYEREDGNMDMDGKEQVLDGMQHMNVSKTNKCETSRGVIIFIAIMSTLVLIVGMTLAVVSTNAHENSKIGIFLLSPPSEHVLNVCSSDSMKSPSGVKECKESCVDASCCYQPVTIESSCLEDNNEVCDAYNAYCSPFYIAINENNPGVISVGTTMRTKAPKNQATLESSNDSTSSENDANRNLINNRRNLLLRHL